MKLDLYFAYGSNMSTRRFRQRCTGAVFSGTAHLAGWRLIFDKPGVDGSAKANLVRDSATIVWGVLWKIERSDWESLDRAESGYERIGCEVRGHGNRTHPVQLYRWPGAPCDIPPFDWYRDHILEGAREHGLPTDLLERLARVETRSDPRRDV